MQDDDTIGDMLHHAKIVRDHDQRHIRVRLADGVEGLGIRTRAATSMALIGSSARMTPGSSTMARAMATRCACPPDRSMGYRAANTAGRVRPVVMLARSAQRPRHRPCPYGATATAPLRNAQRASVGRARRRDPGTPVRSHRAAYGARHRSAPHRLAMVCDLTAIRGFQAEQHSRQRRFARAGSTDDCQALPAAHLDVPRRTAPACDSASTHSFCRCHVPATRFHSSPPSFLTIVPSPDSTPVDSRLPTSPSPMPPSRDSVSCLAAATRRRAGSLAGSRNRLAVVPVSAIEPPSST